MSRSRERGIGETERLARFTAMTEYGDLGDETVESVEKVLVDTLAACYAGTATDPGDHILRYAGRFDGSGASTVVGSDIRTLSQFAALANGTTAHALDVDDGHRQASAHPGAAVIPAALATAERIHASGTELATAVAVGYEAMIRTAVSVQPSHRERHFHATATCGCFGAAAAVASLLDLDVEATANALGLAGTQAGGLFEFLTKGSDVKRFHPGRAAMAGTIAGELAADGFDGPDTIIEGSEGFAAAFADEHDLSPFESLGDPFLVTRAYIKPYPCCRHIHGPIDVVKQFRECGIDPEDVSSIRVETYRSAAYHDKTEIENLLDAQMSIPYGVAVVFVTGEGRLPQFTDYWADKRVQSLVEVTKVVQTDEMESLYPETRPAHLIVRTKDGETYEETVKYPLGGPENPIPEDALRLKFHDLAGDALSENERATVLDAAFDIAAVDDATTFVDRL